MMDDFKAAEMRVAAFTELTAEQGRALYAAYVRRGLEIDRLMRIEEAAREYERETDCKVPDYGLRATRRKQLFDALNAECGKGDGG